MANPQVDAQEFFNRGLEHLRSGQVTEALDDFTQAIQLRPDVSLGYRYRAYAHTDAGNLIRAIADLDEAIRLKPDDVQCYFDRSQNLLRQKQYDLALSDANKGLTIDAGRADLLALRGKIQSSRGMSESAEDDLSRAIEMDPEGSTDWLVWRGELYLETDQPDRAILDFSASLHRQPDQAFVLAQRANAFWLQDDKLSAREDFDRALEIDPSWGWCYARRGLLLMEIDEPVLALADFDEAIRIKPDYLLALELRSELHFKSGRFEAAFADVESAMKLARDPAITQRLLNRRATYHYQRRDYLKSARDHLEALKKEPNRASTFNFLGWVYATAPDPNVRNGRRALECATRACELSEWQNASYLDTLAAAHAEVGQFDKAVAWIEKAHDLAEDESARDIYSERKAMYELHQPLRVTPGDDE
jgi:tetratricopeptide (TPR) repeat protein